MVLYKYITTNCDHYKIKRRIKQNEIWQIAIMWITRSKRKWTENKYFYRTKKYNTNTENQLYIDTLELIKNIYGTNVNNSIFSLVP